MDFKYDKIYHLKSIEQLVSEGAIYNESEDTLEYEDFYLWGRMLLMFDDDIYINSSENIHLASNNLFLATNASLESSIRFIEVFASNNTIRECSISFGLFQ